MIDIAAREGIDWALDADTCCWNWLRGKNTRGYAWGHMHRKYWEAENGPIPDGHQIHHVCRNPSCVNPDHLAVLTRQDHLVEHHMVERGYSFALIRRVRADRAAGLSFRDLCAKYDLAYSTVRGWCRSTSWAGELGGDTVPLPTRICEREDCDNRVVSRRPDKRYCSAHCRTLTNQRLARRRAA